MLYVNLAIRTYPKSLHDGHIETKIRQTESIRTRQTEKTVDLFYIFLSCFFIYTAESVVKTILIQYHCCIKLSLLLLLPLPEDPEDPDAPGEASLLFI